ncbi:hypothetical protein [Rhizobium sp. Root1203]|uniref:hypothetical protein n=1 Tax=Rhizobium sp. Root1203 TaxID=1736427 RepID=UPI000B17B88E|nr:hypothetical protein [Rhizobium sp. Root1203]
MTDETVGAGASSDEPTLTDCTASTPPTVLLPVNALDWTGIEGSSTERTFRAGVGAGVVAVAADGSMAVVVKSAAA